MTGPTGAAAKRRVLVVEDEMLIGMLLEDMLTDLGHEVAAIVPRPRRRAGAAAQTERLTTWPSWTCTCTAKARSRWRRR